MKRYERKFSEGVFNINVSFVKKQLTKVKPKLIKKKLGNLEINNILNNSFLGYGIYFDIGFDHESTNNFYGEVRIIKGAIDENGVIYIYYYSDFYTIFEDDYLWNDFIKVVESIVYHELVHQKQLSRSKGRLKTVNTSSNLKYLSNKHEIMAHAQQFIFDAFRQGYTKPTIKNLLKSKEHIKDFISIDSFWKYYDYFGSYDFDKEDKYSYVWPLFLKYSYMALDKI